jgi:lysophospholipase L1-like esterase
VIVLQAGTNNLPWTGPADQAKVDEVVNGIKAIIGVFQQRAPEAAIVLTGVFPRSQNRSLKETIEQINTQLAKLDDGKRIRFLNINDRLADADGKLREGMSSDGLHLEEKGYDAWAEALQPVLTAIMGPPAAEDHAPPPTGNPGAAQAPARGVASQPTTPGGAEVPDAVRIMRPTAQELAIVEKALANFKESADPQTKAVLKKFRSLVEVRVPRPNSAIVPALAPFFRQKHEANVEVAKAGKAELLLLGDSITDFWRNERGPFAGKQVLEKHFSQWNIANFGIAGDTTQGVLYRLQNGEGKGISPRAVMLMIGTNNTGRNTAEEIAEGIGAVVLQLRKCFPESRILLLGVFPRGQANDPVRQTIREINDTISKLHDGDKVRYLDIGAKFLNPDGKIPADVMSDALHPSSKGYEIWAEAVATPLKKLMEREPAREGNR